MAWLRVDLVQHLVGLSFVAEGAGGGDIFEHSQVAVVATDGGVVDGAIFGVARQVHGWWCHGRWWPGGGGGGLKSTIRKQPLLEILRVFILVFVFSPNLRFFLYMVKFFLGL